MVSHYRGFFHFKALKTVSFNICVGLFMKDKHVKAGRYQGLLYKALIA